jgi:hypothetical protein
MEDRLMPLAVANNACEFDIRPFQIVTLHVA